MRIHTCFISYERPDLTVQAVESYLETVTMPWSAVIVDNGSSHATILDLLGLVGAHPSINLMRLGENRYPGYACNRGWENQHADLLHRADNDFSFRPGWCEEVCARFAENPRLGQLGLRTDEEELHAVWNVGGNNVIRRELWDKGLRYDEKPWPEYPPGYSEDSYFSPAVKEMGYEWGRVKRPCIISLASGDWDDEYYAKSYGDRRIERPT